MERETVTLKVQNWQPEDKEQILVSTIIKDVPPYKDFLNLFPPSYTPNGNGPRVLKKELTCGKGFLAKMNHSITIGISDGQGQGHSWGHNIAVLFSVENQDPALLIEMEKIKIKKVHQGKVIWETEVDKYDYARYRATPPWVNGYNNVLNVNYPNGLNSRNNNKVQQCLSSSYGDVPQILGCSPLLDTYPPHFEHKTDAYVDIHLVKKKPVALGLAQPLTAPAQTYSGPGFAGSPEYYEMAKKYFLSQKYSDLTIVCKDGKTIPAHQIFMASTCEFFEALLENVESGATITNEDFSSDCVVEIMQFLYTGKPLVISKELFLAAGKYGMKELKGQCEHYFTKDEEAIQPQNAIEMYEFGKIHGSLLIMEKAKQVIFRNKEKFMKDANSLNEFHTKYPDLLLELVNL